MLGGLPATLLRLNRVAHARRASAALGRCRALALQLANLAAHARAADAAADEAPVAASGALASAVAFAGAAPRSSSSSAAAMDNVSKRLEQASRALVGQLLAERHYLTGPNGEALPDGGGGDEGASALADPKPTVWVDPRFLVFEYGFDLLLRARQVEMVRSFVGAAHAGESRVQQMIMGAGKTTVIGPLLTLLLADGARLVAQVMPSALLEMSRHVLRKCFTCPLLPKRVYTLSFDRFVKDAHACSSLYCFPDFSYFAEHKGLI